MQQQADEEELSLSGAALVALQEFAIENNLGVGEDVSNLRLQVQERMDVKDRYRDLQFSFGEEGKGDQVTVSLRGINPELGQTLASTGLTVWRAAEEMARFMWEYRRWFVGKSVVELGAGLGLCGVLASHLCRKGKVVITDGGEEFTDSAMETLRENLERNSCLPSYDERSSRADRAEVFLERLTWGDHSDFVESHRSGFDFILAADVLYAEEAVSPLLHTVADILNLRRTRNEGDGMTTYPESEHPVTAKDREARDDGSGEIGATAEAGVAGSCALPPSSSTFVLAFARRHVSIDRVLAEAEELGLRWKVPEDFSPTSSSENIYLMWLA